MNPRDKNEIQNLFNQSSIVLADLETLIRDHFKTPQENIDTKDFNLIQFPKYYIRKKDYYNQTYNLDNLIEDTILRDNVAYALMQSDLYNYLLNRFSFWGSIRSLLIKSAITNIVSILEAILISTLKKHHEECKIDEKICKYHSKCETYIRSPKSYSFSKAIEEFEKKIMTNSPQIISCLIKLKDIRNNIHLTLLNENEFKSDDYTIDVYNEAVTTLEFLKTNICQLKEDFSFSRSLNCKMGL